MARTSARVEGTTLVAAPGVPLTANAPTITVGTPAWSAWLEEATSFTFASPSGSFSARKEQRARGGWYWKAYRTVNGTLHRCAGYLPHPQGRTGLSVPINTNSTDIYVKYRV
jgi:LuxR family transcriptional regulator, maltose regulon positive regulatory protein